MDIYHIWCNLKPGVGDVEFVDGLRGYFEHLKDEQSLRAYRITRCKLGFRPSHLQDFHIMLEFDDLTQMQRAFERVAARKDPIENLHHLVNSKVKDVVFALYRDFPDEIRSRGEERF